MFDHGIGRVAVDDAPNPERASVVPGGNAVARKPAPYHGAGSAAATPAVYVDGLLPAEGIGVGRGVVTRRTLITELQPAERTLDRRILLKALSRHDDALAQAILAAKIEPLSPLFQLRVARILEDAGRQSEATEAYHRALEMDPFHPVIHALSGVHFLRAKDFERAARRLERWADLDSSIDPALGAAVVAGITRPAQRAAATERVRTMKGLHGVVPMVKMALLLELDALEAAADCVLETTEARHPGVPWMLVMPDADRLYCDPRIAAIMRFGNLPRAATES